MSYNDIRRQNIEILRKKDNITPKEACIAVACSPTRKLWEEIAARERWDGPTGLEMIKEIEKYCYAHNLYPGAKVVCAVVGFALVPISQDKICQIIGLNTVTARLWMQRLKEVPFLQDALVTTRAAVPRPAKYKKHRYGFRHKVLCHNLGCHNWERSFFCSLRCFLEQCYAWKKRYEFYAGAAGKKA